MRKRFAICIFLLAGCSEPEPCRWEVRKELGAIIIPVEIVSFKGELLHKSSALWDTGSESTLIDESVVSKLNLKPIQLDRPRGTVSITGERTITKQYKINIRLQCGPVFLGIPTSALNIPDVSEDERQIDMVIGMDVISVGRSVIYPSDPSGLLVLEFGRPH